MKYLHEQVNELARMRAMQLIINFDGFQIVTSSWKKVIAGIQETWKVIRGIANVYTGESFFGLILFNFS